MHVVARGDGRDRDRRDRGRGGGARGGGEEREDRCKHDRGYCDAAHVMSSLVGSADTKLTKVLRAHGRTSRLAWIAGFKGIRSSGEWVFLRRHRGSGPNNKKARRGTLGLPRRRDTLPAVSSHPVWSQPVRRAREVVPPTVGVHGRGEVFMRIVSKRMMLMAGVFLSSGLMLGAASAQTTTPSTASSGGSAEPADDAGERRQLGDADPELQQLALLHAEADHRRQRRQAAGGVDVLDRRAARPRGRAARDRRHDVSASRRSRTSSMRSISTRTAGSRGNTSRSRIRTSSR